MLDNLVLAFFIENNHKMEFYESTSFGMRVTIYDFVNQNKDIGMKFKLIPMCHIGSESFYATVEDCLHQSDLILYEGSKFKSWKLPIDNFKITAKKLGLVTQFSSLRMKQFKEKLIHADFDQITGKREWSKLSFLEKLKYNVIIPIWIYLQDFNITREKLVKNCMRSVREQELVYNFILDKKGKISDYVGKSRNQIVFEKIKELFNERMFGNLNVSIIYGADHMKPISRLLIDKLNYNVVKGKFLEIFKV